MWRVVDALFAERRLAELYDPLDPDRSDLDVYAAMVREFGAGSVLDIGCGTGTFACLLARRGLTVTAVDPAAKAWLEWYRERSYQRTVVPGVGAVQTWGDVLDVKSDLVSFRSTFVFEADGAVLTSASTLRFRHRDEVIASLAAAGYLVEEVRQAPDRPGRELVFIARRADVGSTWT